MLLLLYWSDFERFVCEWKRDERVLFKRNTGGGHQCLAEAGLLRRSCHVRVHFLIAL